MLSINNPGNIRINPNIRWVGEVYPSHSTQFCEFIDMPHGYRVMFVDLANKIKAGTNTVEEIIDKYAPPEDHNNTEQYIADVEKWSNVNEFLSLTDGDKIIRVVAAMSQQENGVPAVMDDVIAGFNLQPYITEGDEQQSVDINDVAPSPDITPESENTPPPIDNGTTNSNDFV